MKLQFVVPRYGVEILGGAESAARMLAERIVRYCDWDVEVLSTCALDHISWENELAPGKSELNGVSVYRFINEQGRLPEFFELDAKLKLDPLAFTLAQSRDWVDLQGPISKGLLEAIETSDAEFIAFYPYLFHPSVIGVTKAPSIKVLHPAAHDEPALYLDIFKKTFSAFDGFVYHAPAERRLAQRVMPIAHIPQITLGLGTIDPCGVGKAPSEIVNLGNSPYIISLGRIDEMKGSVYLAEFFIEYKKIFPSNHKLLFVGPDLVKLPRNEDIIVVGPVSEADKWDLLRGADLLISPSAYESFSLVIFEAWKSRVPVLVNSSCEVTLEHCKSSKGGVWFDSFRDFCSKLYILLTNSTIRSELAENGFTYTQDMYNWENLVGRYCRFLERLGSR